MKVDLIIKNGHIIDPSRDLDTIGDIAVSLGKIVDVHERDIEAERTIDATGCYIFPGLIDFHSHVFYGGTNIGVNTAFFPATGVTATVDAGSSGCANYGAFHQMVAANGLIRVRAYLSCYSMGLGGGVIIENFDPKLFQPRLIQRAMLQFPGEILGLKMRISKGLTQDLAPLTECLRLADFLGVGVCVHITNPVAPMREIANLMRTGDVMCHIYHGIGETILDENGKILPEVIKARSRGVIMDASNGNKNYSTEVCKQAMAQGFFPDIISTDMANDKLFYGNRVRSLPFLLSKYLSLGMNLMDVIRCATAIPAKVMGMEGQIGTLAPGAFADVSVFRLQNRNVCHYDALDYPYIGKHLLIPQLTVVNGQIAFGQEDFSIE